MAVFDKAFEYVLENEGVYSDHPLDRGGKTAYGITEIAANAHHCPQHQFGLKISDITRDLARHIYFNDYWKFSDIKNEKVAIKLFDIAVNVGKVGMAYVLQRALKACGENIKVDGIFGTKTEFAANKVPEFKLLNALSVQLARYYVNIVQRDPKQIVFLEGWIVRAVRLPDSE